MLDISLSKDTFYRRFGEIGYLFNQSLQKETVLDSIGSLFVSQIERFPRNLQLVSEEIAKCFHNVEISLIENDLLDLIQHLGINCYFDINGELPFIGSKNEDSKNKMKSDTNLILKRYFQKNPVPLYAHLEITSACNLQCIHCYWPHHRVHHMPKNEILFILDELRKLGCVHLTLSGGEPLLHPDILDIIEYARLSDLSVTLMTNGTNISMDIATWLKSLDLASIQITLYSMRETVHDTITGIKNSFSKTRRGIETLLEGNNHVKIANPVMKQNLDSFIEVDKHYRPLGVFVDHDLEIVARSDFSFDNTFCRLSKEELKSAARLIRKYENSFNTDQYAITNDTNHIREPEDPVCGAGIQMLSISVDGTAYPCPNFSLSMGNVLHQGLSELFENSIELDSLRSLTNSKYPKCMSCPTLEFCSLCPANFFSESGGDYLTPCDYFCQVAKAFSTAAHT